MAAANKPAVLPPALGPGGTIAVVSPSAGFAGRFRRRTDRGVQALQALGYKVKLMPHALENQSWVSAPIEDRVADLEAAFTDPEVTAIISAIGGNHSAQLLPTLNMEIIAAHPKIFCGYSDITSLLNGINVRTGLVTFYGPALLPQLGEFPRPLPDTISAFRSAVAQPEPLMAVPEFPAAISESLDWASDNVRPRLITETAGRQVLRAGQGAGRLVCGCVPTLRHLIGTPWEPDFAGSVLVLDLPDRDYDPGELDADLWHLVNSGRLEVIAALLVGRLPVAASEDQLLFDQVVMEVCAPFRFPVISRFELGHGDPSVTLPIGCEAEVDGGKLIVTEPGVR